MTTAPDRARPARRRLGWKLTTIVAGLLVLAVLLANLITAPYVLFKPGSAYDVLAPEGPAGGPMISVEGHKTYPTEGSLRMTTISMYGGPGHEVSWWEVGLARLGGQDEILRRSEVFPEDVSEKQVDEVSTAQMVSSQASSTTVALKAAGVKVTERPLVAQVMADAPAEGVLEAGDVVLQVGGQRTTTVDAVQEQVQKVEAGQKVAFVVERDGRRRTLQVPTRSLEGRTVVGVALGADAQSPVDVTVDAGAVGGPSAGLMFALAIYDVLTPGALTGGQDLAGTGTISAEGQVGPIDGIGQKMIGAREAGATWFLAPDDNCDEVEGHVPEGMREVAVTDFAEARKAVEAIAAGRTDGLTTCQDVAAARG